MVLGFEGSLIALIVGIVMIVLAEVLLKAYSIAYKLCLAFGIILAIIGGIFLIIALVA